MVERLVAPSNDEPRPAGSAAAVVTTLLAGAAPAAPAERHDGQRQQHRGGHAERGRHRRRHLPRPAVQDVELLRRRRAGQRRADAALQHRRDDGDAERPADAQQHGEQARRVGHGLSRQSRGTPRRSTASSTMLSPMPAQDAAPRAAARTGVVSSANTNGIVARLASTSPTSTTIRDPWRSASRPTISSEMSEPIACGTMSRPASSGVLPADRLPVQREQEEHPEHERAERRRHRRARAEPAVGEQAEVEQRLAAPPAGVRPRTPPTSTTPATSVPSADGVHPAARRGARQAVGQQREPRRQEQETDDVQAPARASPSSCGSIRSPSASGTRHSGTMMPNSQRQDTSPTSRPPSTGPERRAR